MNEETIEVANSQIQSYDLKGLSIEDYYTPFPCIIFGTTIRIDVLPSRFSLFTDKHLCSLELMGPEIIIIGTGAHQQFPKPQQLDSERAIEFMDTGSACRVFNILMTEDRPVLAALFPD